MPPAPRGPGRPGPYAPSSPQATPTPHFSPLPAHFLRLTPHVPPPPARALASVTNWFRMKEWSVYSGRPAAISAS